MNSITAAAVQTGNRTVVAGSCFVQSSLSNSVRSKFCATRLFSDGTIDISFGNAGRTVLDGAAGDDTLKALASAGNAIFMTGNCYGAAIGGPPSPCIAKLTEDGTLEATWGAGGWALLLSGAFPLAEAGGLLVDPDGSATLAATCSLTTSTKGCLLRLQTDGSIDSNFGAGGIAYDLSSHVWSGFGSLIRRIEDQSYVVGGVCGESQTSNAPCAWIISPTGTAETSFGSAGAAKVLFPPTVRAFFPRNIPRQGNGKLLVATTCVNADGNQDFCLARLLGNAGYFDLDSDNATASNSDALLYLRHLLGFHDTALTSGALGTYADRTSATDIATYLSTPNPTYPNCSASIVGAPGGPQAMLDGIVLLRAMMGLTGDAVTNGIAFPAGTTRTSWVDIKAHLNGNCGMVLN